MFDWENIYKELARKLLAYRNNQAELLNILKEANEQGLPVIPLTDKKSEKQKMPLAEIDPFTFFASFNRSCTDENRLAILSMIKERLSLESSLPTHFGGLPVANNMNSWFFPWAYSREVDDIDSLWNLAEAAIQNGLGGIDDDLYNRCLEIRKVGAAKLTMGLFWLNPKQFISADSRNRPYFQENGIAGDAHNLASYRQLVEDVRTKLGNDFVKVSHKAFLRSSLDEEEILIEEALEKFFDGVILEKNLDEDKVPSFFLNHEWNEFYSRKEGFEAISEIFSKPLKIRELEKVMHEKGKAVHGSVSMAVQRGDFFDHKDARKMLGLITADQDNPPTPEIISKFIDKAVIAAFHDPVGKPQRANAALFTSAILTAVYPEEFVDFRQDRWKWASKNFGDYKTFGTGFSR